MTDLPIENRIQLLERKIQGLKDEAQGVYDKQREREILGEDLGASYDALKGEAQRVDTEIYEHGLELGLLMERLEGEKLREAQARKGATA